jgi:hypothetical protein
MPAKKKINNESKTTEINVKSDMKRCKQIEEKLNECINTSDEDESNESNESNISNESNEKKQLAKSDTKNKYDNIIYSPDTYVLKFGKYKGMKAKDVKKLEVEKMNKKTGESFMCNVGKQYLEFLLTLQWLCKSDKKVIGKILFTD